MRVAHVSTFPPLRCGIASFASDLAAATHGCDHVRYALHYGDAKGTEASAFANVSSAEEVAELARVMSNSDCDVVSLQHEFGIWGGAEGEHIHAFLDHLNKPLLSVLHTTFAPSARSGVQGDIVRRLVKHSDVTVVLTEKSKQVVEELMEARSGCVVAVPHGLPSCSYLSPPADWASPFGSRSAPLRLVSPGFFRENKGVEEILFAIAELRDRGFGIAYRIVGEPQRQFQSQSPYLVHVERLIVSLGLQDEVTIDARYLPVSEQIASIQAAHFGIFGYQDASLASSGTVPLVMGAGRPVLCTPFEYAQSKAEEGPGVMLADGYDWKALARLIERAAGGVAYEEVSRSLYERCRSWAWPTIGGKYRALYEQCC